MAEDIKFEEVRIKKVATLSQTAQDEVKGKLQELQQKGEFKYKGYAKVNYIESSPLSVHSIDPIEGTIIDVFSSIKIN